MDQNCIFCKIIEKEIPAKILFEDNAIIVFEDIKHAAPIHYLVVPKIHIESINHLTEAHRAIPTDLIMGAKLAAQKLELTGYKLVFNVGRVGGQIVDHIHLHLLGGWNEKP